MAPEPLGIFFVITNLGFYLRRIGEDDGEDPA